jgi:hypothetical protein
MNALEIETIVRARLKESNKTFSDTEIQALVRRIEQAGMSKMASIGETALHAEKRGVSYSPDAHLRAIGS